MPLLWRIYYGNGATVDSGVAGPFDVVSLDVQAVVVCDPDPKSKTGSAVLYRKDFYWWETQEDSWNAGDSFGLWDYLQRPGPRKVLFGRTISTARYTEILDAAVSDPDMRRATVGATDG